jgi:SOS regulatory protein LexA
VQPDESTQQPFDWRESLDRARSSLQGADATAAAAALFKALTDAALMAELCHDKLFNMPPGEISDEIIGEWSEFLNTLYTDTLKIYIMHSDLAQSGGEESLLTKFEAIRDTSRTASFGLKYMDAKGSEQEGREAEVVKLSELMLHLQAAVAKLEPEPQVYEANEISEGIGAQEVVYVPRVGRIAAGRPILAEQSTEDTFPLPRQLVGGGILFLLKVTGDSMIGTGIADGDLVVVREQPEVENGEIAVAMIDGEATVKTFKRSGGHVWLVPHNRRYAKTLADEAAIIGKVVAVLRKV